jgi:DNA repair protein RecO (recombination protein O)
MPRPPRVYKSPAIVLRQRKLGETDKIITLYTAEYGKVEAVAKGVRRVKSRLAGNVEPLTHGAFLLARGRNLDIITQIQSIESFQPLHDDLGRLSHALYAAELLDRATEEREENFALYRLLLDTLRRLTTRDDLERTLRYYEMAVLGQLGYKPEVQRCVVCGAEPERGEVVRWAANLGGGVCSNCKPQNTVLSALSPATLTALRVLQREDFQELVDLELDHDTAVALEHILRDAIHYALDQDVRSAAFLDEVRRRPRLQRRAGIQ